jgi:hypothetical protein
MRYQLPSSTDSPRSKDSAFGAHALPSPSGGYSPSVTLQLGPGCPGWACRLPADRHRLRRAQRQPDRAARPKAQSIREVPTHLADAHGHVSGTALHAAAQATRSSLVPWQTYLVYSHLSVLPTL